MGHPHLSATLQIDNSIAKGVINIYGLQMNICKSIS